MHASAELLVELVEGELHQVDARWIVPHVRRCTACTDALREVVGARVSFGSLLRGLDHAEPPEWAAALRTLEALGVAVGTGGFD
jgi:hypothetical protein